MINFINQPQHGTLNTKYSNDKKKLHRTQLHRRHPLRYHYSCWQGQEEQQPAFFDEWWRAVVRHSMVHPHRRPGWSCWRMTPGAAVASRQNPRNNWGFHWRHCGISSGKSAASAWLLSPRVPLRPLQSRGPTKFIQTFWNEIFIM